MEKDRIILQNPTLPKIVFGFSGAVAIFWSVTLFTDVYHFAVVGAIYEILWLPMILLVYILPFVSLILWILEKFNTKSFSFYAFLLLLLTVVIIVI